MPSVQIGGCARRISAPSQLRVLAFKREPEAPRGTRRVSPLRLTDSQITVVFAAAPPLAVQQVSSG